MITPIRRPESATDEPNTMLSRALSPARASASHSQGTRQDWRRIPMSSALRRHMQTPTETPVAANIQFASGPSGTPFRLSRYLFYIYIYIYIYTQISEKFSELIICHKL